MSRVRTALAGLESESHPDDATVAALATDIDSAVEYMFANFQLPPEPDIALHAVLARLMANTRPLQANPSACSPVVDMHDTVHNSAPLFDGPHARTRPTHTHAPRSTRSPGYGPTQYTPPSGACVQPK